MVPTPSTDHPRHGTCMKCSGPIIGMEPVVTFEKALFHLNCSLCTQCHQTVDLESPNVQVLANGRLVCESCSSLCKRCGHIIGKEAIMTGNESYHAGCFRCVSCNRTVGDLGYTQTSKGILCTPCHEKKTRSSGSRPGYVDRPLPSIPMPSASTPIPSSRAPAVVQNFKPRPQAQDNHNSRRPHRIYFDTSSSTSSFYSSSPSPSSSSSSSSSSTHSSSTPSSPSASPSSSPPQQPRPSPSNMKLAHALGVGSLTASLSETSSSKRSIGPSPTPSASTNTNASRSRSNHSNSSDRQLSKPIELPAIPSLNLSFFDDDSSELSNLTKSLGVSLYGSTNDDDKKDRAGTIGTTKINRASELLKSSLDHFPSPPTTTNTTTTDTNNIPDNVADLKLKLKQTSDRLASAETHLATLKTASQKALDEFSKAKEEFAKEVGLKQQHEYTILQLRHQLAGLQQHQSSSSSSSSSNSGSNNNNNALTAEKEIDRLASVKVELERSCNQLKQHRDTLANEIDNKVQQAQAGLEASVLEQHQLALQEHIRSLLAERDALLTESKELAKSRDEVVHEMVVLNTKNAELSSMNNDLSRRMSEREREAAAIMAGTGFLHNNPSPSPSTELLVGRKSSESSVMMQRMTSRDSSGSKDGSSKMFKMKKPKGSNVFNKLTSYGASFGNGSSSSGISKKDYYNYYHGGGASPPSHAFYGAHENQSLYNLNTMSSLNMASEMKRKDSKQSYDGTTSPGSHAFLPTSFLRPVKCAACGEKIWGATEYRCQGCGSICHTKCMAALPALCYATSSSLELSSPTESEISKQGMFGTSLTARVAFEERDIPLLVEKCIEAVEARGMDYEGIYRKSGGAAQMRTIQMAFETNTDLDLKDEDEINDICAVTSVLKQYFRELPNPLLTYELYDPFMEAVRMSPGDEKTSKFMELLSQLPKANYDTLKRLMSHLDNVRKQSESNLMTTKNLAMVFGPTLLCDKDASRDLVDMSYKNATIEFIINHTHLLFAN